MSSLSSQIEQYLLRLLSVSPSSSIELQRGELARFFDCVPSQINYVLSTRFTLERGFLVTSRRGGAGFVRIARLDLEKNITIIDMVEEFLKKEISEKEAFDFISRLAEERYLTKREESIFKAAIQLEGLPASGQMKDCFRGELLLKMVKAVLTNS